LIHPNIEHDESSNQKQIIMSKTLKYLRAFFTIIALFFALSCDEDDSAISTVNVTSVESDNFYPGDQVTMQGSNFTAVLFVFLGNNQIPFQLDGDALTFTLPANAAIGNGLVTLVMPDGYIVRSEEHTSELQSRENLVCRLLLEKKKHRQQHI